MNYCQLSGVIYKGLLIFCNKDLMLQNVSEGLVISARSCYSALAKITTKLTLNDPNYMTYS